MGHVRWWPALLCAGVAAGFGACSPDADGGVSAPELRREGRGGRGGSLGLYGSDGDRGDRSRPCRRDRRTRQFDFWLGEWDVTNVRGTFIGTNSVTSELDGCVVQEHWSDGLGSRGRSLNAFDTDDGQWHQTWVAGNLGHLRMAGGFENGIMTLTGRRVSATSGREFLDTYTWTALHRDTVRQTGLLEIPSLGLQFPFTGIYGRVTQVTPIAPVDDGTCVAGASGEANRAIDFWLGEWKVDERRGPDLGVSTVTTDLSGCLMEEAFRGRQGFRAIVWTYFDAVEQTWYRTYVDAEGERVELSGALADDGSLVLTGSDRSRGEEVLVRMRLAQVGPDEVEHTVEVSRDNGVTWRDGLVLRYRRRS